jgi:hypothetical protein
MLSMPEATHRGLPILAVCANRLMAMDTTAANHSIGRRCVIPIISLQNNGDSRSFSGLFSRKNSALQGMGLSLPIACLLIRF